MRKVLGLGGASLRVEDRREDLEGEEAWGEHGSSGSEKGECWNLRKS